MTVQSHCIKVFILVTIVVVLCLISIIKFGAYPYHISEYVPSQWNTTGKSSDIKFHSGLKLPTRANKTRVLDKMHEYVRGKTTYNDKQQNATKQHTKQQDQYPTKQTDAIKQQNQTREQTTLHQQIQTKQENTVRKEEPDKIRETTCSGCFTHNFQYMINNEHICQKKNAADIIDLFIMIFTIQSNFKQRAAIRKTWLTYSKNNTSTIRYAFLLGKPKNDDLHEKIVQENNVHGDLLKEDFVDTYMNLTYKTMMGFKWVVSYCPTAKYVLKTDDDMYINVPRFSDYLKTSGSELETRIAGSCENVAYPIRNSHSKWYASVESYKEKMYPSYCSGTGYLTSMTIVRKIYNISPTIPFFHLEDIYVAICLRKVGGTVQPLAGFNRGMPALDPCLYKGKSMFTSHQVSPETLETIWKSQCNVNG